MRVHLKIDKKYRFDRNHYPDRYPYQVVLPGLVPNQRWCAEVLATVRDAAEELTGGTFGLFATRDSHTRERIGYRFGANDPAIVHQVTIAYERAVRRAGGMSS